MPASLPNFFLVNPVARGFKINDAFNKPRNYTFAPTKLQLHEGIDIMALDGQNQPVSVLAAQRGIVNLVGFSASGYGNYVRIVHEWGDETWVTWYGHLSEVTIEAGRFVLAGQKIGIAGTTGFSSGIHLHLTLQHIGHGLANYTVDDVVDPEPLFRLDTLPPFDDASLVSDVSIPNGTQMKPGQSFEKIWRVRNTGTTTWSSGYELVFAGSNQMGGPNTVILPTPVQPGQVIDTGVSLVAPDQAGQHQSVWQFRNPQQELFGHPLMTQITIKEVKPFNEATFIADVTVEDGTIIQPGEQFVKTWRVRNSGSITWTEQYALRFFGDDRMEGPNNVPLGRKVAPGETIELSVTLTAPQPPGRYRSTWKLCDATGKLCEYELYAEIRVPKLVQPAQDLNELRWAADVTIPDEMKIVPGAQFVKTWRVRNSGNTTWGQGYTLAFFGNEKMGGPDSVSLAPARPGDTVEVSVTLTAPTTPGLHRSTWKPRDPQGNFFEFDLFALINVVAVPTNDLDELNWVEDVTIPDGSEMRPGQSFTKIWRVRNTGTTTWDQGYQLAFFGDDKMNGPKQVTLPKAKPGDTVDVSVALTAPTTPGRHKSTWKGRTPQGKIFEYDLFALIDVVDAGQTFDMLDYLQGDGHLFEIEFQGGARFPVQCQMQDNRFYYVRQSLWEEMWADDHFIYRGSDTTSGSNRVITLNELGQYGCAWIPRKMSVGIPFRRMPLVLYRRKRDGEIIRQAPEITWIKLEAVQATRQLSSGVELPDVAVLAMYRDRNGQPASQVGERYFYAKGYGLVAREAGASSWCIVADIPQGSQPDNQREILPWLTV